jgi:hypothetical protein
MKTFVLALLLSLPWLGTTHAQTNPAPVRLGILAPESGSAAIADLLTVELSPVERVATNRMGGSQWDNALKPMLRALWATKAYTRSAASTPPKVAGQPPKS